MDNPDPDVDTVGVPPTPIPDLGIDAATAATIIISEDDEESGSVSESFTYSGRNTSVRLYHKPKTALFARQALTLLERESYGNTNPFHGAPNTFHVRLDGDNVAVWSDENPGPDA